MRHHQMTLLLVWSTRGPSGSVRVFGVPHHPGSSHRSTPRHSIGHSLHSSLASGGGCASAGYASVGRASVGRASVGRASVGCASAEVSLVEVAVGLVGMATTVARAPSAPS